MADHTVQDVIRKAVADETFRALLLNNPTEALAGFDLTDDERRRISQVDPSLFEGSADHLEDRLSRGFQSN